MMEQSTNFNFGVGGVVLRDNEILLVRHTYGAAKGKLLIPGGALQIGEMPEAAVVREVYEETGVRATVKNFIGIRFQAKNWYAMFMLDYVSGEPTSDGIENDFSGFIELAESVKRDDITGLSRLVIESVINGVIDIPLNDYFSGENRNNYMLYGLWRKI
jgi:ADP-ribose pyrophosphatase YjhB (NUDIX family)